MYYINWVTAKNGNTNYEILLNKNDQVSLYELNEKLFELEYTKEDFVQSPSFNINFNNIIII